MHLLHWNWSHLYYDFEGSYGVLRVSGIRVTCIGLVLPLFEDQPLGLYWSRSRRTDYELLLQLQRSACIAITILVRLQQVNRNLID
jgi:hypothetical protein